MKPTIEYRPKSPTAKKGGEADKRPTQPDRKRVATDMAQPQAKAVEPTSGADFIVIRRNRAKYNAYMRAYRAKKKAEK